LNIFSGLFAVWFYFRCCSTSEDMESNTMVDDVYDIITAMAATAEGRTAVCEKQTVTSLCQAVANHCYRMFTISFACSLYIGIF